MLKNSSAPLRYAVVPKPGSEAYDVSKEALSHLVRELAVSMAPKLRVNAILPAIVVKGSMMFPRERGMASLRKYNLPFDKKMRDDELSDVLAQFYAKRTLTHQLIDPNDCAQASMFLAGACRTLHHRRYPHPCKWRPYRGLPRMNG